MLSDVEMQTYVAHRYDVETQTKYDGAMQTYVVNDVEMQTYVAHSLHHRLVCHI